MITKHSLTQRISQTIWIRSSICLPVGLISTFCRHVSIFQATLHQISAFVRKHIWALFGSSLFAVVEARRLVLTRMTEAHFIRPLHHLHFPFYKPLISLSLPPSPRLSQIPLLPPLPLNFLQFTPLPLLLFSQCLPPSLGLLGIVQSHSHACEVNDLCNLPSRFMSFFWSGTNLTIMWRLYKKNSPLVLVWWNPIVNVFALLYTHSWMCCQLCPMFCCPSNKSLPLTGFT